MKKLSPLVTLMVATLLLAGCAHSANEITADYVSPLEYDHYNCKQLHKELKRVSTKVRQLSYKVDRKAKNDQIKTTIGVLVFFPTLFFLDGNSPEARQYAQLKGQYKAISDAMQAKKCA